MKKSSQPETEVRLLKIATCPSLSGRSTLTYQVFCSRAESEVFIRVTQNSGNGQPERRLGIAGHHQ